MTIIACVLLSSLLNSINIESSIANSYVPGFEKSLSFEADDEVIAIKEMHFEAYRIGLIQSAKEVVEITYSGRIVPPMEYTHTAMRSGKKYSGVLKLESYVWKDGKTIATYSGELSPTE